jgi:hypothetical protein
MTIDLDFRPASYGDFSDPVTLALNGVQGQRRREMIRDILTARGDTRELYDELLGSLGPGLLGEKAEAGFVSALSNVAGPSWMVDEYEGAFTLCQQTSWEPLLLREVIRILETADEGGAMRGYGVVRAWWHQQWEFGDDPEDCTAFAWVESDLYPQLPEWYEELGASWRAARQAKGRAEGRP